MLAVGDKLPTFTLHDQRGEQVAGDGLGNPWLLVYWYPKADTPGCAAQAQAVRDQLEAFQTAGCTVAGASFDTVDEIAAFHSKYLLNFPLLADPDRSVGKLFGVAGEDGTASHASRTAFLFGPDGTLAERLEVDDPEFFADHALDLLEELQA